MVERLLFLAEGLYLGRNHEVLQGDFRLLGILYDVLFLSAHEFLYFILFTIKRGKKQRTREETQKKIRARFHHSDVDFIFFVFFSFVTFVLSFFAKWVATFRLLPNAKLSIVCCIREIISSWCFSCASYVALRS